ncbi:MAG: aminotransferase class IV [Planctomycetes bacterium]|nr:aminotransferase class IV [Planctomycetota bacterium]
MVPPDGALVRAEDAGLQHAVGLFETMAALNGRVFRLEAHLDRMQRSAVELGLARSLDVGALAQAVRQTLEHNKLTAARVRLTVTPGGVSLLRRDAEAAPVEPTVLVVAHEPVQYDPAYFEKGIMVRVAGPLANPFDPMSGHKTLAYWSRLRSLRQAAGLGAAEALWLSVTNHLASGAVSNIFLVRNGELQTPIARGEEVKDGLPAPVLPGITRAAVIELALGMGVTVHRRMLGVADLLDADEVFLTNSGWHVLPVTSVEKKTIGDGRVGETTTQLRTALLELIDRETRTAQTPA